MIPLRHVVLALLCLDVAPCPGCKKAPPPADGVYEGAITGEYTATKDGPPVRIDGRATMSIRATDSDLRSAQIVFLGCTMTAGHHGSSRHTWAVEAGNCTLDLPGAGKVPIPVDFDVGHVDGRADAVRADVNAAASYAMDGGGPQCPCVRWSFEAARRR